MTTSAPPPRDPELAADPDYRQAAAEGWYGRVADYYAGQQAEVEEEARAVAAQDAELDARQMDAQHQEALAENAARAAPRPATAAEAWAALTSEGPTADAVRSYLAPGPEPRYDTPQAQAQAELAKIPGYVAEMPGDPAQPVSPGLMRHASPEPEPEAGL